MCVIGNVVKRASWLNVLPSGFENIFTHQNVAFPWKKIKNSGKGDAHIRCFNVVNDTSPPLPPPQWNVSVWH